MKTAHSQIEIWLPGQPSRTTHQSGTKISGRRIRKTPALIDWEDTLRRGLLQYRPDQPLTEPLLVRVAFGFQSKRKRDAGKWKVTRPDLDNLVKTVMDILTQMKFWVDDSQVVVETLMKYWTDNPGIRIWIETLDEENEGWQPSED